MRSGVGAGVVARGIGGGGPWGWCCSLGNRKSGVGGEDADPLLPLLCVPAGHFSS